MSKEIDNLSEEDFDKNFDKMMSMSPEEFDNSQTEIVEETLAESPNTGNETELQTEDEPKHETEQPEEIEQPQEELVENEESEPSAEEQSEEIADETIPVVEDSKESEEFNFENIPRDKIIPHDINVNGMTVRATMTELEEGFKKGMNYTQKMQEIAPHRKNMNLMTEHGLTTDDLNLLVEAKQGNKEALGRLMANAEIDPLEVEAEESKDYTPKNYAKEPTNIEMEQIKSTILSDTENAPVVENALQTMPEDMYLMVSEDTRGMNSLYNDIKSGLYQQVMPEVIKQQSLYGKQEPTLQTYLKVAEKLIGTGDKPTAQPEPKIKSVPKVNNEELNTKRRSAAPNKTAVNAKPKSLINEDLSKLDDDEFEKAFQQMVGRSTNDFK